MNRVKIIAEAGVNHNGDMDKAKELIDVAAESGADYVKFQSFKAENLASKQAKKATYQKENMGGVDDSQYEMLKSLELSHDQHLVLQQYANSRKINFFSTAFDVEGLEYLNSLGFELFKSPSGEITNYLYLRKLAGLAKPVIISTGMSNLNEINEAIEVLTTGRLTRNDITVLHCNTQYPTPMHDVNLRAMNSIGKALGVAVGYSDHTLGIEVPVAAVALGASVIEKHFTLDRNLPGPDHKASLEPTELKAMVAAIRNVELALSGDGVKQPSPSEFENMAIARKSIHTTRFIKRGEVITEKDITALRPGDGISPMKWKDVVGKRAKMDFPTFHMIKTSDLGND
ncbi:MAG: N-acetylneuraminate synthase [Marinoscillum sp.]